MGGSQSQNSRKLSVDNENAITVSQEALDRIQAQLSAKQAEQPRQQQEYIPPPQFYESKSRQQENAAEESYWNQRIENLKKAHESINKKMQLEYQKTLKEANALFDNIKEDKVATRLPPCQEEKAKVLQCYSANADKSLVCSVLVNQFNDCVCKNRLAAVSAS